MSGPAHFFGIRHHGPGSARSLLAALAELQPDCLLVEGPPEADALLSFIGDAGLQPPVALLTYNSDAPNRAAFFPFAEFSPEWQALRYAQAQGITARFIDLPQSHQLLDEAPEAELSEAAPALVEDPMDWLGRAAGYADGEAWWNAQVEERLDATALFTAVSEAVSVLRAEFPQERSPERQRREARREAHMRKCLREAQKEGFQRIAVVCGAWHVPALAGSATAKADNELLKGLPKAKVACTWVPWTYRHLTLASGYGAGLRSPGWYEHLWRYGAEQRPAAWLARVAQRLRAQGLDCSPAQVIDSHRLADTLAALRERPAPGLDELQEAVLSTVCLGDVAPLKLIERELIVGERLGQVPAGVPAVALQKDLEQQQKRLRLKPEALEKALDLDLREPNGLARSQLLHRLALLELPWGEEREAGGKGSFHERWQLQWQPEFSLRLVEASRWGSTVEAAASECAWQRASASPSLAGLTQFLAKALLADLPAAVSRIMHRLAERAALTGDVLQLLAAIPPLARVLRYGDVRQTRGELLQPVLDGLLARACIGLKLAVQSLDDEAARQFNQLLQAVDQAVRLQEQPEQLADWQQALFSLAQPGQSHGLVAGLAARLLFDSGADQDELVGHWLPQALSRGNAAADAAAWLEGFLQLGGLLLVHDARLWQAVDDWLCSLKPEHFLQVLPLVRRSFAAFSEHERRQLNGRARQGQAAELASVGPVDWDAGRAALPLPFLRRILGLEIPHDTNA